MVKIVCSVSIFLYVVRSSAHHYLFCCATSQGRALVAASSVHPSIASSSDYPFVAASPFGASRKDGASQFEGRLTGYDPFHVLDFMLHQPDLLPSMSLPPKWVMTGREHVTLPASPPQSPTYAYLPYHPHISGQCHHIWFFSPLCLNVKEPIAVTMSLLSVSEITSFVF